MTESLGDLPDGLLAGEQKPPMDATHLGEGPRLFFDAVGDLLEPIPNRRAMEKGPCPLHRQSPHVKNMKLFRDAMPRRSRLAVSSRAVTEVDCPPVVCSSGQQSKQYVRGHDAQWKSVPPASELFRSQVTHECHGQYQLLLLGLAASPAQPR